MLDIITSWKSSPSAPSCLCRAGQSSEMVPWVLRSNSPQWAWLQVEISSGLQVWETELPVEEGPPGLNSQCSEQSPGPSPQVPVTLWKGSRLVITLSNIIFGGKEGEKGGRLSVAILCVCVCVHVYVLAFKQWPFFQKYSKASLDLFLSLQNNQLDSPINYCAVAHYKYMVLWIECPRLVFRVKYSDLFICFSGFYGLPWMGAPIHLKVGNLNSSFELLFHGKVHADLSLRENSE